MHFGKLRAGRLPAVQVSGAAMAIAVSNVVQARFGASDLERLCGFSLRLRALAEMIRRKPGKALHHNAAAEFRLLCDEVRLQLRVAVEQPPGVTVPRTAREALRYMQCPVFCQTTAWSDAAHHVSRRDVDPRVQAVVNRLVDDSARVGVPLAPSAFGELHTFHIGHAVHRYLPWSCWDLIGRWALEAGAMAGFALIPAVYVPGHFQLDPDAPEWSGDSKVTPRRLTEEEARAERDALFRFYAGGSFEPPAFHSVGEV